MQERKRNRSHWPSPGTKHSSWLSLRRQCPHNLRLSVAQPSRTCIPSIQTQNTNRSIAMCASAGSSFVFKMIFDLYRQHTARTGKCGRKEGDNRKNNQTKHVECKQLCAAELKGNGKRAGSQTGGISSKMMARDAVLS